MLPLHKADKKSLRAGYLKRRAELSLQERHSLLTMMLAHLDLIDWPAQPLIFSFRASAARHEVPIHYVEETLIRQGIQPQFCYPRTCMVDGRMEAVRVKEGDVWTTSAFGIEEPEAGEVMSPADFQVVFVPLIALDERGYRIGYGKGFYDRYLAQCDARTMTIGFSWFPPIPAIEDIGTHDIPLQFAITPFKMYAF
jgi:5-formyltetrahydrofolate cyclo-ligase